MPSTKVTEVAERLDLSDEDIGRLALDWIHLQPGPEEENFIEWLRRMGHDGLREWLYGPADALVLSDEEAALLRKFRSDAEFRYTKKQEAMRDSFLERKLLELQTVRKNLWRLRITMLGEAALRSHEGRGG